MIATSVSVQGEFSQHHIFDILGVSVHDTCITSSGVWFMVFLLRVQHIQRVISFRLLSNFVSYSDLAFKMVACSNAAQDIQTCNRVIDLHVPDALSTPDYSFVA